jgi:hypothetical protein
MTRLCCVDWQSSILRWIRGIGKLSWANPRRIQISWPVLLLLSVSTYVECNPEPLRQRRAWPVPLRAVHPSPKKKGWAGHQSQRPSKARWPVGGIGILCSIQLSGIGTGWPFTGSASALESGQRRGGLPGDSWSSCLFFVGSCRGGACCDGLGRQGVCCPARSDPAGNGRGRGGGGGGRADSGGAVPQVRQVLAGAAALLRLRLRRLRRRSARYVPSSGPTPCPGLRR